jgi:hypothetical protein
MVTADDLLSEDAASPPASVNLKLIVPSTTASATTFDDASAYCTSVNGDDGGGKDGGGENGSNLKLKNICALLCCDLKSLFASLQVETIRMQ